jgi:hypothetical protein
MNTQRIGISKLVRSILLIVIGIVIGISIGISIGRIGNAPVSISQRVFGQVVGQSFAARAVAFNGRVTQVVRLDAAALDRVLEGVVSVDFDGVRDNRLLV